jgi:aminopeptidase N
MRIRLLPYIVLFAVPLKADTYQRQPSIDVVHYQIALELNDNSDSIAGTTRIQVMMTRDQVTGMWLDFSDMAVDSLKVGGISRPFTYRDGKLAFEFGRPYSRHEIAVVEVRYHGKPQEKGLLTGKNKHGRRVIFAENWPDSAHHWFPSIDHPWDKATAEIIITAPDKYDIVANGRLVETRSLLDGRKMTYWEEDKPIPTYCMVFGAAEFLILPEREAAGAPLYFYLYPQDADAGKHRFARSNLALTYFNELIGPYPYEKLAQVESTTRIGGMENASSIFYAERVVQDSAGGDGPVPHEIAHQWFGDSITEADWDHLWLSEGFATYFNALFYEHLEGPASLTRIMARAAEVIMKYGKDHPAPIIDPEMTDLNKKLNPLNYQKGAWVLHMLRRIVGEKNFFEGIRRYYLLYAGKNALSEDFEKVMESVSGTSLSTFFRQWLYQPGWPDYKVTWHWDEDSGDVEISIRQAQTGGLFDMPVEVVVRAGDQVMDRSFDVSAGTQVIRLPVETHPSSLEIDPGNWVLKSITITELQR